MEICHQFGGNAGCWVLGGLGAAAGHQDDALGSSAASRQQGPLRSRSWHPTAARPGSPREHTWAGGGGPRGGVPGAEPARRSRVWGPGTRGMLALSALQHGARRDRPGASPEPFGSEPGEPSRGRARPIKPFQGSERPRPGCLSAQAAILRGSDSGLPGGGRDAVPLTPGNPSAVVPDTRLQ